MKFGFVAKHREIWPVRLICGTLEVSRSGFYAWLARPPSAHARRDEALAASVKKRNVISRDRAQDIAQAFLRGTDVRLFGQWDND